MVIPFNFLISGKILLCMVSNFFFLARYCGDMCWHSGLATAENACIHCRRPRTVLALLLFLLPDNVPCERQQAMASVTQALPPMWETWMQLWDPDVSLFQLWPLGTFGNVNSWNTSPVYVSLSPLKIRINKQWERNIIVILLFFAVNTHYLSALLSVTMSRCIYLPVGEVREIIIVCVTKT